VPGDKGTWHWNVLGEDNIGDEGLICDRCQQPIDVYHPDATWAAMNPVTANNETKVTFEGYHISQLLVPWVVKTSIGWRSLLEKRKRYPRQKLNNEVFGRSYDSGVRPITRGQLKACCREEVRIGDFEYYLKFAQSNDIFAGIDWGTGENSFTVISLGAYLNTGTFSIFWIHRFEGEDLEPVRQLDRICSILARYNVCLSGCDYGGGFDRNDHLIRAFGPQKILKYQYNPNQKKGKVFWDPKFKRFMCHRTEVMSDVFNALVRKQISLPNWDDFFEPYGQDVLNIFSEFSRQLRMTVYNHSPGTTDDSYHSILYCFLASMIKYPRPDIIAPLKDTGEDFQPKRRR
jgi:hypothetical protein